MRCHEGPANMQHETFRACLSEQKLLCTTKRMKLECQRDVRDESKDGGHEDFQFRPQEAVPEGAPHVEAASSLQGFCI